MLYDFIKPGDRVLHRCCNVEATVVRVRAEDSRDGRAYYCKLDFGRSVKGPFNIEMNGKEFRREALVLL